MRACVSLAEQKFGRWSVLQHDSGRMWKCRCDCGVERSVRGTDLLHGISKSCGCLSADIARASKRKHGMAYTRLYSIWRGMKKRCYDPNHSYFYNYGGREAELGGPVTICAEWRNDFSKFAEWALHPDRVPAYSPEMTIDRRRNEGHYEPGNCRWATRKEQAANKGSFGYVSRLQTEW